MDECKGLAVVLFFINNDDGPTFISFCYHCLSCMKFLFDVVCYVG